MGHSGVEAQSCYPAERIRFFDDEQQPCALGKVRVSLAFSFHAEARAVGMVQDFASSRA